MREVEGSLLSIAERGEAFGHGCNCEGVMGGLAAKVEERWPAMAAEYLAIAMTEHLMPWLDEQQGVWIYNLATQQHPGADARLDAIADSVRRQSPTRVRTVSGRCISRASVPASVVSTGMTCARRSRRWMPKLQRSSWWWCRCPASRASSG